MGFESLRFVQFRNWSSEPIEVGSARRIVLIGANGQGKTNFLEGVYLLCYGSSFRTKNDRRLSKHGEKTFSAHGTGHFGDEPIDIDVRLVGDRKQIIFNGNPVRDRKDLVRAMPCVAFTHEDFQFVSGAPEFQRFFFDQTLSLFDVLYIDTLRDYRKILKIRNALLNQFVDPVAMEVYERQLALSGLEISKRRREAVENFNAVFSPLFAEVLGLSSGCQIRYQPSWKDDGEDKLTRRLFDSRAQDAKMGFTSHGPHRDRFLFQKDHRNFAEHASTGQVRVMSLLLRMAQATLSFQRTGRKPVLLLDDVLLELDSERRNKILEHLPPYEQAFFTFLPDYREPWFGDETTLKLQVDGGRATV